MENDDKVFTEKKNQHYIPKFYLRNFSYQSNGKQIGIFNSKADKFFQTAKLKTQGSKPFFYGYDGHVEEHLANIERRISTIINEIAKTGKIDVAGSHAHAGLLTFVALTHLRSPVSIDKVKTQIQHMNDRTNEDLPESKRKQFFPEITHEVAITYVLSQLPLVTMVMADLKFKLLVNETSIPFIASDFPIIKYNRFLESVGWRHGKTGYGNVGLQIFIPLNPKYTIVLYDSAIYKVGNKKSSELYLTSQRDVDELNLLQILNCYESVFFNEYITESYVRRLYKRSQSYTKPHQTKSSLHYMVSPDNPDLKHKNLVIVGATDCETGLTISGISMHSRSKKYKFHDSIAQIRPWADQLTHKNDEERVVYKIPEDD